MLKHLLKIKYNKNIINRSLFIDSRERERERELEKLEKEKTLNIDSNLSKKNKVSNLNDNNNIVHNEICEKYIKSSIETKFPL